MITKFNKVNDFFGSERHLIAASIARIGLGSIISLYYLLHIFQRYYYWGPNGIYPFDDFKDATYGYSFSLYQLSDSLVYFDFLFFTGAIIALLYTVGFKTRYIGILNYIFIWSLYERNPFVLDGGNNILIICLFFLLFANVGAHFAISKNKKSSNRFLATLHNLAITSCIIQVAILYFFSGMFKAQGEMWYNGVSLYYILQVSEYTLPSIAELIYSNPILLTLGSLSAIIIQIAFPFLIIFKSTRWIIVSIMVMFHLGIIIVMGLFAFGFTMIILDLLVFNDDHYRQFYYRIKSLLVRHKTDKKNIVENAS
ncbi:HTTM domain-containing protein [Sporosarcina sp. UB5]|uniref:HTTM domain-containing protein n=1 Tax=Sporosarcina sp. UB5 TaxID=3047463 RepID=UPI003D78C1AC